MPCPRLGARCLVLFALLASVAQSQTYSVLYNFGSNAGDPTQPFYSGIIAQGRDGNLYSTALGYNSATGALGVAFKITPAGVLTPLVDFLGADSILPYSGLTLGSDGNFYGTAYGGGVGGGQAPYGTIFQMTPSGTLNVLYTFTNGTDGALPIAPPVEGFDGNYYGTTCSGCNGQGGFGSIYKVTTAGTFSQLYDFDDKHGANPNDPLLLASDGNFYGTTEFGGANGAGEVFRITPSGVLIVLHSFAVSDGQFPVGPLLQARDGNFYGTTMNGGSGGNGSDGVIFRVKPNGVFNVIHEMNGTSDGSAPTAGLIQATDGSIYGVNSAGGATSAGCPSGCGTIFRITPTGLFSVIYNFDQATGQTPYSTLMQHTNGLLYGMTNQGGTASGAFCSVGQCGVFFSLNIGAAPFVNSLANSGRIGNPVQILGQGLTGATGVSFAGVPASFKVRSDTFMTATIPAGARTGFITVTASSGNLKSSRPFAVMPVIKTFTPTSGPVGTVVTITGTGLTQTRSVTFNGVSATFTVNTDTQVTATVPAGAKTGPIGITTVGGVASSPKPFTVT